MSRVKTALAVALALLLLVVIVQNTAEVETKVLLWSFTMPRALLLLVTLVLGVVLGLLWSVRLKAHGGKAA